MVGSKKETETEIETEIGTEIGTETEMETAMDRRDRVRINKKAINMKI